MGCAYRKEKISSYLRLFSSVFSTADLQAGCSRVIILCFQKFFLSMTHGEACRFLINLQSQSHTNLLLIFHTTSNGPLICYLPVHSRHSCILKTFSQSSQTQFLSKIPSHEEKTSQRLYTGLEFYDCLIINPLTKLLPKSLNSKPSRHVTALHSLLSLQLREFICTVFCSLFQLIVQLYLENKGNVLETITDF